MAALVIIKKIVVILVVCNHKIQIGVLRRMIWNRILCFFCLVCFFFLVVKNATFCFLVFVVADTSCRNCRVVESNKQLKPCDCLFCSKCLQKLCPGNYKKNLMNCPSCMDPVTMVVDFKEKK